MEKKIKIYDSINVLPLKIFEEIGKTGDIKLLCLEDNPEKYFDEIVSAWENINKEIFDIFGFKDNQIKLMQAKIKYLNYMVDYYMKNDRFSRTLALLEEQKMNFIENEISGKPTSFIKICVGLSNALKYRIDYGTITTAEFFYSVELAEEIAKSYKSTNK